MSAESRSLQCTQFTMERIGIFLFPRQMYCHDDKVKSRYSSMQRDSNKYRVLSIKWHI